jgi:hypothetical protein
MSPASYRTAPPRTTMLANGRRTHEARAESAKKAGCREAMDALEQLAVELARGQASGGFNEESTQNSLPSGSASTTQLSDPS